MMNDSALAGTTVLFVPNAQFRALKPLSNFVLGAGGGGAPNGSLVLREDTVCLKVRYDIHTFHFEITSGNQVPSKDSARCVWSEHWEIVLENTTDTMSLFSR
jgi:hypothetical protein